MSSLVRDLSDGVRLIQLMVRANSTGLGHIEMFTSVGNNG